MTAREAAARFFVRMYEFASACCAKPLLRPEVQEARRQYRKYIVTRIDVAQCLLFFAWALVRYAGYVIRYELSPTAKHLEAEHRWHDHCEVRWLEYRLTKDHWRNSRG